MHYRQSTPHTLAFRLLLTAAGLAAFGACSGKGDPEAPAPTPPEGAETPPADETPPSNERRGISTSAGAAEGPSRPITHAPPIDPRRSLAVTDKAIVGRFSLKKVLDQLVAQSGVPGVTSLWLFRQLWDTQNKAPGAGLGPNCTGTFNGFPYDCSRAEGVQAFQNPFISTYSSSAYIAIGLFNRFDLAPADGSNCGEYRIIFARRSGAFNPTSRSLLIFEAVLDNPDRAAGLRGCKPVADFWAGLSSQPSAEKRAEALVGFYFRGLPGFQPVVHVDNYGNAQPGRQTGQIRSNQFMGLLTAGEPWLLREFKLKKTCGASACELRALPATVKGNPFGELFADPDSSSPLLDSKRADFQNHFLTQIESLANPDINLFSYEVPDRFNDGEGDSQTGGTEDDYLAKLGPQFEETLQGELDARGIGLTPQNVVDRALALSCAGCHQRSPGHDLGDGLSWPASLTFTHVAESLPELGPDGLRFRISPALTDVFLPRRKAVLQSFLSNTPLERHSLG